jgi:flagellar motility protein MotE (MotC chaperone)
MQNRPNKILPILCVLLLISAVVRLGSVAGPANALVSDEPASEQIMEPVKSCEAALDFGMVTAALTRREATLTKAEKAIAVRRQALSVAGAEIDRKMTELMAAESALKDTLTLADSAAENDLIKLTEVYENMKSKDATAVFEHMDHDFAAGFLGRMSASAAAGILAGLAPEKAYAISVILAARNSKLVSE